MINKRLIGLVPDSMSYIKKHVLVKWISLAFNILLIFAVCEYLQQLLVGRAGTKETVITLAVILASMAVRAVTTKASVRLSFLASKQVKKSLRQQIYEKLLKLGASSVYICDSPLALYEYTGTIGGMFVDIGGGKTEVHAVSGEGVVAGCTVNIAGDAFTNAIIDYIADTYYIKIGDITADKLKCESLSFYQNDQGSDFISGTGLSDGMPKNAEIKANDLFFAIAPLIDDLVDVISSVLGATPPELAAEIMKKGFFITGASSQIAGLSQYLADRLGLYCTVLDDVENAAAIGGGKFLDDMATLSSLIGVQLD